MEDAELWGRRSSDINYLHCQVWYYSVGHVTCRCRYGIVLVGRFVISGGVKDYHGEYNGRSATVKWYNILVYRSVVVVGK